MNTDDRILVFIPTYNCASQIERVLRQFADPLILARFEEILVLDNHSRDDTVQVAVKTARALGLQNVKVARNCENYGLGGSHKSVFRYAQQHHFDYVVVLHGDDQADIRDLIPILDQGDYHRYDCCLGSRFSRRSTLTGYSLVRIVGNYVFNVLFSIVSMSLVTDLGSGLNLFARSVYASGMMDKYSDDLRFNCYLLLGLIDLRKSIYFFPISWREEDQVSNAKLVSQSLKTMQILFEYVCRRRFFRHGEHRAAPKSAYALEFVEPHTASSS